jgi:hypothetical protein
MDFDSRRMQRFLSNAIAFISIPTPIQTHMQMVEQAFCQGKCCSLTLTAVKCYYGLAIGRNTALSA